MAIEENTWTMLQPGRYADPSVLFDPVAVAIREDEVPAGIADGDEGRSRHGSYCLDALVEKASEVSRLVAGASKREAFDIGGSSDCLIRFRSPGDAALFLKGLQRLGLLTTVCEVTRSNG